MTPHSLRSPFGPKHKENPPVLAADVKATCSDLFETHVAARLKQAEMRVLKSQAS